LFLLPAKNKSISATVKLYYLYAYKSTIDYFLSVRFHFVCSASLRLEQSFRFAARSPVQHNCVEITKQFLSCFDEAEDIPVPYAASI
jgi:hypothetical protein